LNRIDQQIVYAPTGDKLALMNGISTLVKAYVPLPDGGRAVYNSSGLAYYQHADWLGSMRLATSSTQSQTPLWSGAYAPFGESYSETPVNYQYHSFTGQNEDTVQGLDDFMFREYSVAQQGRWISPDPVGVAAVDPSNPQSWNRYAYVLNAPTFLVDPLGLYFYCGLYCDVGPRDGPGGGGAGGHHASPLQDVGTGGGGGGGGQGPCFSGIGPPAPGQTRCEVAKKPCSASIGQRVVAGVQGVLNIGLGEAKTAVAFGVAGITIIAAPETEGTSLFVGAAAGYAVVSSHGQVLSGLGQLYIAAGGSLAAGQGLQQAGDIMGGPITGIPTLVLADSAASAQKVAGYEGLLTAGASFLENETLAQAVTSAIDMTLSSPAARSESDCGK